MPHALMRRTHAASVLHYMSLLTNCEDGLKSLNVVEEIMEASLYMAAICHGEAGLHSAFPITRLFECHLQRYDEHGHVMQTLTIQGSPMST